MGQAEVVPKGWKRITLCSASILVPKNMSRPKTDVRPIDSCFDTFANKDIAVNINEDPYAPPFRRDEQWQDYTEAPITVGKLTGKLLTFRLNYSDRKNTILMNVTTLRLGISPDERANAQVVLSIRHNPSVPPETIKTIVDSLQLTGR